MDTFVASADEATGVADTDAEITGVGRRILAARHLPVRIGGDGGGAKGGGLGCL